MFKGVKIACIGCVQDVSIVMSRIFPLLALRCHHIITFSIGLVLIYDYLKEGFSAEQCPVCHPLHATQDPLPTPPSLCSGSILSNMSLYHKMVAISDFY